MPEGNEVHRFRDRQAAIFVGRTVRADSPSGQFPNAVLLDGRKLRGIVAHGKHLGYDFGRDLILHVHLGRFGDFTEGSIEAAYLDQDRLARAARTIGFFHLRPEKVGPADGAAWTGSSGRGGGSKAGICRHRGTQNADRRSSYGSVSDLRHWQYLPRRTAISGEAQSLSCRKRCRAEDDAGDLEGCDEADGRRNDRPAHCDHASKGPTPSAWASRARGSALCL